MWQEGCHISTRRSQCMGPALRAIVTGCPPPLYWRKAGLKGPCAPQGPSWTRAPWRGPSMSYDSTGRRRGVLKATLSCHTRNQVRTGRGRPTTTKPRFRVRLLRRGLGSGSGRTRLLVSIGMTSQPSPFTTSASAHTRWELQREQSKKAVKESSYNQSVVATQVCHRHLGDRRCTGPAGSKCSVQPNKAQLVVQWCDSFPNDKVRGGIERGGDCTQEQGRVCCGQLQMETN